MPTEDLDARRWFRDRLRALGAQYPELKTPESQERLTTELERQEKEEPDHGLQTDRQTRGTTQNEGVPDHLPQDTPDPA